VKLITVLGARPQFVKAAPVSAALRRAGHQERLVHTGQHYDPALSEVFFSELDLPRPQVNLGIGSGSHGSQTGRMLAALDELLQRERPDWVVVHGDTNSTLAGALCAAKLGLRLAHLEAGLRCHHRGMPEEINRLVADHCADLLLCPTETAMRNLEREGLGARSVLVGDPMLDVLREGLARAPDAGASLARLGLAPGGYLLVTIHRPATADHDPALRAVLLAVAGLDLPALFPVHPRTRPRLDRLVAELGLAAGGRLHLVEPVGYLEMLTLERHARAILTDSGGVQKEAFFQGVPCVTLRSETEWPETLAGGWNLLAPAEPEALGAALRRQTGARPEPVRSAAFGDGHAAQAIVAALERGTG
jgi:UDP-N-acetylglucosamine 2-epimerase